MHTRRGFIKASGMAGAAAWLSPKNIFARNVFDFESKRPLPGARRFTSEAVEATIQQMKASLPNKELGWLFENCFPNTLDTTVFYEEHNGVPDTYIITGDIDAMWLRDSSAQVHPYIPLAAKDKKLQRLIAGVINRQVKNILKDPYANAFYKDENQVSEWKDDLTDMKPGIHERKWEIDSLCFPIRLAYEYWKTTGDTRPFTNDWKESIRLTVQTFTQQQRKHGSGPYSFQRKTAWATDGVPLAGYGYPAKPVGLICSMFRPSDDATIFPYLIPSNFFAVTSLKQAAEMLDTVLKDATLAQSCHALATEVAGALKQYAVVEHAQFGKVYAYEVNGFGSYNLMDDANNPSLLSLPYLHAIDANDAVYKQTRKLILSTENPFFFKGKAAEGIGGPHAGMDMIWPLGITMRALTAADDKEITACIRMLIASNAGTGFMHESFYKDDPSKFTRKWFAWSNTLFGEMILYMQAAKPALLKAV
ncbi:glycoside hydrolase family 125 protein [Parafilimonas sp.]|uniref:glycoside hydrolase family 125 protein n=1 Tax=Parafilimonas sp. TaxID=1969739 RepID=UPI0039E517B4